MDLPRFTFRIGIDENGLAALAERFGEFRGKLMAGDHLNIMTSEFAGNQAASVPAESVVASQRISVADDECLAHGFQLSALSPQLSAWIPAFAGMTSFVAIPSSYGNDFHRRYLYGV